MIAVYDFINDFAIGFTNDFAVQLPGDIVTVKLTLRDYLSSKTIIFWHKDSTLIQMNLSPEFTYLERTHFLSEGLFWQKGTSSFTVSDSQ